MQTRVLLFVTLVITASSRAATPERVVIERQASGHAGADLATPAETTICADGVTFALGVEACPEPGDRGERHNRCHAL